MGQRSHTRLLAAINRDLPRGVDWKAGARTYLSEVLKRSPDETYLYSKPFSVLSSDGDHDRASFVELILNFINVFTLLDLRPPSRILDVACGSGWLADFYERLGFGVYGVDISEELLGHARRRVPRATFAVHDVEESPLPGSWNIDAAIFESCLHHFYDPISALANVRTSLSDDGVVVIIEGENRQGPIKAEYREEMERYRTIERPYSRDELTHALKAAGLPAFAFFGSANGWFTADRAAAVPAQIVAAEWGRNHVVAAKSQEALRRIVPEPWHGLSCVQLLEGFSEGADARTFWSAPFSRFRVLEPRRVVLEIGGSAPNQTVHFRAATLDVRVTVNAPRMVDLGELAAGTEMLICSDAVFVGDWTDTSNDARPLSFWVRFDPS